ncbi:MAG: TRAP transporter permease DctM/Q [Proteobacteria bacterium]|nr:MAG: TRAP transporter permease DctM/Q [Pseudomonadota bacterium]QKK11773.1 MAG: TRAP transporter fused permease subunit [Pseudomonadota bacterium]
MSYRLATASYQFLLAAIPFLGILWLVDLPLLLRLPVLDASYLSVMVGMAIAAGFLRNPYGKRAGALELTIGILALACWFWAGYNHGDWLIDIANRGPEKWLPGLIGLVLLLEALRKNCGTPITALVSVIGLYAFLGHHLPGAFEAPYTSPARLVLYLYSDTNGVPGLVLGVCVTVVLGFIVLGAVMGAVGSSKYFTDLAMGAMGHRRGGPAKVAVVASSIFGSISGSTVANVMSTGVVTIPLMKRSGFPPHVAAAIEAVASNGGQLAPPVMGATAFLIAEFLQIPYSDVVAAALIPAIIYYFILFMQVDLIAARHGLHGLPRDQLPKLGQTFRHGWLYLTPLALLIYFLFWLGYTPGKTALICAATTAVAGFLVMRRLPDREMIRSFFHQSGGTLVTLILICAAAGIVIGALNISGLGFLLTNVLSHVGESAGLLVMLALTAVIAIFLGMGMPTAAVYILLSIILAPAIVGMGVPELPAHLFIFYFGLLSMLTPPVAIASYAAASLAGAGLWKTGLAGLRLGSSAFILPFLFALNPALVAQGSWLAIGLATVTVSFAGYLLARCMAGRKNGDRTDWQRSWAFLIAAMIVGTSTLWSGPESFLVLVPTAIVFLLINLKTGLNRFKLGVRQ